MINPRIAAAAGLTLASLLCSQSLRAQDATPATAPAPAPAAVPAQPATEPPAAIISTTNAPLVASFIDLQAFDDDLNEQLGKAGDRPVEVEFYTPVSPNQIPARLERRLAAVRKEGGKVGIVQPQTASSTRSITAVVGLFSGLWNFIKTYEAAANERALVRSVHDRDADIVLERDAQGGYFIRKIVFKKRPPSEPVANG